MGSLEIQGAISGAQSGATIGAPILPPYGAIVGGIIGGIAGFFGGDQAEEEQNKKIKAHNEKVDAQRNLVLAEQKKVGTKMSGVSTYFNALENAETDIAREEEENVLNSFLDNTLGQVEAIEEVGAATGLEVSGATDKKISTVKDLTAQKSEDIRQQSRMKRDRLAMEIAGMKREKTSGMRDMWADLGSEYDLLGHEYQEEID